MVLIYNRVRYPYKIGGSAPAQASQPQGLRLKQTILDQIKQRTPDIIKERPEIIRGIVVVDDDPSIVKATPRKFRLLGIGSWIEIAIIGPNPPFPEAVDDLKFSGIDLIIMDGNLPDTSGSKLIEKLRSKGYQGYIVANSTTSNTKEPGGKPTKRDARRWSRL